MKYNLFLAVESPSIEMTFKCGEDINFGIYCYQQHELMNFHKKISNDFLIFFILYTYFVILVSIISYDLEFNSVYGIQEKAVFFANDFNISNNNGTSELAQVAAQGNNVYVVWQDNTDGDSEILFTHSSDSGTSFAPVRNISNNNGTSELPQVAAQGNNVYVVWQDNTYGNYDILLKPSSSDGFKFKTVRNLSNNNGTSELPQVAAQGNNVYVVWQDNTYGNYDILFKRSPNAGHGFRSTNLLDSNGTSELPQVAAQGNNVYVVWQDNTYGNYDILFQSSSSSGIKFNPIRNLSNNNGTSELPQIAVSDKDMYVIWRDNDSDKDRIFFKHGSYDEGASKLKFGPVHKLYHYGEVSQPKIITGSQFFYGVWSTFLYENSTSIIEFYPFMLFEDYSGDSISLTRLSLNGHLRNPDIAGHGYNTFLVWENLGIGNGDIFFKKLSTDYS